MSPELDALLCEKYPKIFAQRNLPMTQTTMCWGFECGDGWFTLIDVLCELIQHDIDVHGAPQLEARQVKQKFGELRFYTTSATEIQFTQIDMATAMSKRTCEECGAPAKQSRSIGGWVSTKCDAHTKGNAA